MGEKDRRLSDLLTGETARYLLMGVCTTLVNLLSFWALCRLTPLGGSEGGITAANVSSISLAILFAYVSNRRFVFRSKARGLSGLLGEFGRFAGARLVTMGVEVGGLWLALRLLGGHPMAGKVLTQGVVMAVNYLLSKYVVFRTHGKGRV